jgi:hypothetical protein
MSNISGNTRVFVWFTDHRYPRIWVAGVTNVKNKLGETLLRPLLVDTASEASAYPYSVALIMKRRFDTEGVMNPSIYEAKFSLTPDGEEIGGHNRTAAPDKDNRTIMQYKGVLVRPFIPKGWCVHLFDGPRQLESVKADTIEEAVDKVIERNQLKFAEKAPEQQPEPEPEKKVYSGPRVRPGDSHGTV